MIFLIFINFSANIINIQRFLRRYIQNIFLYICEISLENQFRYIEIKTNTKVNILKF